MVAEVLEIVMGAAGFLAADASEAAVEGLPFEAGAGCLDFGDDVPPCELGCVGALAHDTCATGARTAVSSASRL